MKSGKALIKFLIALFPLILFGMVIVGALLYKKRHVVEETPMTREISIEVIAGHHDKLRDFMSPRGFSDEAELLGLTRTAAFIEGSISTINTGMAVDTKPGLTQAGKIWNSSTITFEKGPQPTLLDVNYVEASNAEIAVALMLTEALPQRELRTPFQVKFSPTGDTSDYLSKWMEEAQKRAENQPLYVDGIDWEYLCGQIKEYIDTL